MNYYTEMARRFKCKHCGYNISFQGVDEKITAAQSFGFSKYHKEEKKIEAVQLVDGLSATWIEETSALKSGTRSARRRKLKQAKREEEERQRKALQPENVQEEEKEDKEVEEEVIVELEEKKEEEEVPIQIIQRTAMDVTELKKVEMIKSHSLEDGLLQTF